MRVRKKTVIVEAEHFTLENKDRAFNFITCTCTPMGDSINPSIKIQTLEGEIIASLGDWIIRGVNGEFYPVKPDIFEKTYEPVNDQP